MFDFSDQVVMVMGGSGNLGGAVVHAFYTSGAHLVVPDRRRDRVQTLFPELANSDAHYLVPETDVTEPDVMTALVENVVTRFGKIDVLVNTIGGYRAGKATHETSLDTWDFMMDLNARSTFITSRAVIPTMLKNGRGCIINTAAKFAVVGGAKASAYSAAKGAVARLTESMAAEYKAHGITVNSILPSIMDTPQNRKAMPNANYDRWIKPADVAHVILFLASDMGRVINGALIPVYGRL